MINFLNFPDFWNVDLTRGFSYESSRSSLIYFECRCPICFTGRSTMWFISQETVLRVCMCIYTHISLVFSRSGVTAPREKDFKRGAFLFEIIQMFYFLSYFFCGRINVVICLHNNSYNLRYLLLTLPLTSAEFINFLYSFDMLQCIVMQWNIIYN